MKLVYLNDSNIPYESVENHFNEAASWAKEHCKSYIGYHVQDVSDVSGEYDHIAEYRFSDSKEAVWFELKYRWQ
jgi:hypothetical protein